MMENKDLLTIYKNIIQNESLVEVRPSVEGINPDSLTSDGSIYYGTGLCTARELSDALPFDVLGMVLVAEKIRRGTGMKTIYHHIADTHAKSNRLFKDEDVNYQAASVKRTLERMAKNLGIKNFEVLLASEFDNSEEYAEIYRNIKTDKHEYVRREVADIEWYRNYKRVNVKLGWIIQATETDLGFDERVFDREYKTIVGEGLSFVYLKPGRTFDLSRPKVSPYIHVPGEARILLKANENVKAKIVETEERLGDKHLGGARRHLANIVRLYEKLFGSLGNIPFEDKIQTIIDNITK
jgi:hypothetical protein